MLVIGVMFFSTFAIACDSGKFIVYYLPLNADFYVPPSREDIVRDGTAININSCLLNTLFAEIKQRNGDNITQNDLSGLRVLIINLKTKEELFITTDKNIISIKNKEKYDVNLFLVDDLMKEIVEAVERNKRDRSGIK